MNWNRPFAPNFLKNFDKKLLLNKPETWSARTHWVWYYGILFGLLLAGICFIYPNDARSNTDIAYWIFFVSVVSLLALVFWLIYLLRFNVFKRFGNISGINRLKVFGLYFASIVMIIFFTYIPALVETARANLKYGDDEIVNDVNNYNKLWTILEHDSVDHTWAMDTFVVMQHTNEKLDDSIYIKLHIKKYYDSVDVEEGTTALRQVTKIDSFDYFNRLDRGDTIRKLFDSVYEIYTCPNYTYLSDRGYDDYYNVEYNKSINRRRHNTNPIAIPDTKHATVWTDVDVYNKVIKNYKKPTNINALKNEINALIKKYHYTESRRSRYDYGYIANEYSTDTSYDHRVEKRYDLKNLESSFKNIVERKYRFEADALQWQCRIIFYVSLGICLLLFTFRHSTRKTFFLSLLSAVVLSILTGLFIAFSSFYGSSGSEISILSVEIFYTLLFGTIAATVFANRIRRAVTGICINMFVWLVPFFPLMVMGVYSEIVRENYRRERNMYPLMPEKDLSYLTTYAQVAEVLGIVIFLVLLPTFIHKLYRKWYALPEE